MMPATKRSREAVAAVLSPPAPIKIRIEHVTRKFGINGNIIAVDDVSLNIVAGSFVSIVGPSGCGKTTLLRIVAGLEKASSGTVAIESDNSGRPLNAMIFQGDSIFPWMTVWDNAAYGMRMRRSPPSQIKERVSFYLERTGLTRFSQCYPHQLSGGMKQRVSIARAFAADPEVLLMDEPFSALDEQNKTILQQELLRIWEETRKTVLFITHSVDEAVALSDQIVVMTAHPGRIKAVLDVPFERPRKVLELRAQPAYGELVYSIWEHLREEVARAQAQSSGGGG